MLKTSEELKRVASGQGVYRVVAHAIFNRLGASRHVTRSGVRWPKQILTLKMIFLARKSSCKISTKIKIWECITTCYLIVSSLKPIF